MDQIYISTLKKYNVFFLLISLLILSFFIYNSKNFQLDASSDSLILEQDKDLKKYRQIIEDYGASDFLIVTFTDKDKILTKKNLKQISLFIDKVSELEWVRSIQSVFDVPLLEVNNQTLTDLVNNVLTIDSSNVLLSDAEKELVDSPIFKNLIVSEDATTTGLLINFNNDERYNYIIKERTKLKELDSLSQLEFDYLQKIELEYNDRKQRFDKERNRNIGEIRNIIDTFKNEGLKIHLGGVSMIADDTISFVKKDIIIFGFGALIFILIVLYVIFQKPSWMIVCISNCLSSLIVMIGIVSLLGWKVTVISSNFIMLMLILSLSMTVHIVVRYRQFLLKSNEESNHIALLQTVKNMYRPCLFAALTSIFAFATLYTSGIKPVMDFGLMMCAGLIVTYVSSFVFLPTMIIFLNLGKTNERAKKADNHPIILIVTKYPFTLLSFFLAIFCMGIYGSTKLEVENSFIDYFKKDTEIYKGMKLIDDKLGGTTPLDILIDFNGENNNQTENEVIDEELLDFGIEYDPADYWFTNEKVNLIKDLHDHLESYPFAGKVLSLASIIRTAEKINSNNEFDTLELSVLYKKLPEDLKNQILKPFVLIDKNQARITMRIIDTHPDLIRSKFINDLNTHIEDNYSFNSVNVSVAGILILYNNMLESLFDSQIKSLSIVLFGIFMMLFILFRSFKIASLTIIPNLIACFVVLGTMGLLSIPLDLMTITIAAITVGIAVDNSIHYVYRYREYLSYYNDHDKTIVRCNETVGIAIRNTSYTIIAGFSILIFSNFYPTIYFGIFTALAMIVALLGSLTLLPVLLKQFL